LWGFLTPIYIFVLFMGYSMALTFMPGGMCGTLFAWLLVFVVAAVSHYMDHEKLNIMIEHA
jgi:uncharacterized YccA/Bax inhibitor family protein